MKAALKFFLYMGLIMIIMYTTGCYYDNNEDSDQRQEHAITLEQPESARVNETILPVIADATEKTKVVLYFGDDSGNLVAELREIPKVVGIARRTIQELCLGPRNKALSPTIPAGTELLDINIRNGLCIVNFSEQLITAHSGGSAVENQTVYSIVNTLTQFSTVERVQIQVDGRTVDSIAGHIDVSTPLARNSDIIKNL